MKIDSLRAQLLCWLLLPLDRLAHWLAAHPEAELSCPPDDSGD